MPFVEQHSICSFPLSLYSGQYCIGTATGFIWRHEDSNYLVSNWHVFSGRRTDNGQPNSKTFLTPEVIKFRLHDIELGQTTEERELELYAEDGSSRWFQHNDGQDQDVAAIAIPENFLENTQTLAIQDLTHHPMRLRAGLDTISLGFPRGLAAQGAYPIWKSGSLAAEPTVPRDDGEKFYLIDGASREGMSGAPLFAITHGIYQNGKGETTYAEARQMKFIGIYSGRYANPDERELQLVRAWPRAAIEELFQDQVPGSYVLRRA